MQSLENLVTQGTELIIIEFHEGLGDGRVVIIQAQDQIGAEFLGRGTRVDYYPLADANDLLELFRTNRKGIHRLLLAFATWRPLSLRGYHLH
jgi:hypothetical protein